MGPNSIQSAYKLHIHQMWDIYRPQLFITLQWKDLPTSVSQIEDHHRKFKNVFLCDKYGKKKAKWIPDFPDRLGMTFFHEKVPMDKGQRWVHVYHSHIHLFNIDDDDSLLLYPPQVLEFHIQKRLSRNLKLLSRWNGDGCKGVDVKQWSEQRHYNYNFKDFMKYRYQVDGDLVVDPINSDWITSNIKQEVSNAGSSNKNQSLFQSTSTTNTSKTGCFV